MVAHRTKRWFYFTLFLYIYNICFAIMPGPLRTRLILGCIGLIYYCKHTLPIFGLKICSYWFICLFCCVSISILNQNFDFWFYQFIAINIFYVLGAFFIVETFAKKIDFDFNYLVYAILLCILVHNIIAFSGILFSPIQTIVTSIQKSSNDGLIETMMENRARAIGIGDGNFFHGGVFSGIGLILVLYLGKLRYISALKCTIYFLIILISGIFIARTTICGLIGFIFLFIGNKKERKRFISISFRILSTTIITFVIVISFLSQFLNLDWAFEFIYAYMENGSVETASTNQLSSMFILPENIWTYMVGDGKMLNQDGSYYMHSDVGVIRHLFYWGIVGIIIYFMTIMNIWRLAYKGSDYNKNVQSLLFVLFIYMVIINLKGLIDISFIIYLFVAFFSLKSLSQNENWHIDKRCDLSWRN